MFSETYFVGTSLFSYILLKREILDRSDTAEGSEHKTLEFHRPQVHARSGIYHLGKCTQPLSTFISSFVKKNKIKWQLPLKVIVKVNI